MLEQIWIVLLFLVVLLFNLIAGVLTRRRQRDAAAKEKKASPPAPRAPQIAPRMVVTPPRSDVSLPAPPRRRRAKLGRGELRRAIVVMTLLGPPRALVDEGRDLPR